MIVLMEQIIIYTFLVLAGLCMGSFAGATVWRLRARELIEDKKNGEKVDEKEYKKLKQLTQKSFLADRSKCLNCGYDLKWYDLVPVLSWLSLSGKCRKCHKPIGYFEILIEISVAAFFVVSYFFWPYSLSGYIEISMFVLWLVAGVGLAILFAYDAKWLLLPDSVSFSLMGIGFLNAILVFLNSTDKSSTIAGIIGSLAILSGLYWLLYVISKGKWIGFGDIKLGIGLALMLADWRLAFVALFAANLIGCLVVIPAMITGKLNRGSHVPFGPLLIAGFVVAGLFGSAILSSFIPYFPY